MKKDFIKRVLKNGIKVYLYSDKNLKRTVFSYNVKYGNLGYFDKFYYKDECCSMPPAMAHFLEHYLIEESKYGNMLHRMRGKNYEVNAVTYPELTSYYFVGIKDVYESIKEMIYMVDEPVFSCDAVESVKCAIISEVRQNDDQKYRLAYNLNRRNTYANFDAVYETCNTLGSKETTESITCEDVKLCYDAYYNDENKFIVVGGNFDVDEMLEYLNGVFSELKPHENHMRPYDYEDDYGVRKPYDEIYRDVDTDHLIVTYKFKNDLKMKNIVIDLLLYIYTKMKFRIDSDFVTSLIDDKIIVGSVSTEPDFFKDVFTLTVTADVLDKSSFLSRLEAEFNTDNLDPKQFELIKKNLKVSEISRRDNIYAVIKSFPNEVEFTEKMYTMDVIDSVTLESLKKLIDKLKFDVKTVTLLKSKKVD